MASVLSRMTMVTLLALGCGSAGGTTDAGADSAPPTDSGAPDVGPAARDATAVPDAAPLADATPVDAPVDAAAPLGADGDPCAVEADCQSAGHVIGPQFSSCKPGPSWPNGYCRSFCTAPTPPEAGAPLVQGDCPRGSVCLPTYMASGVGYCLRGCTADSDCRAGEGYYCRRDFAGVGTTTGVCAAPHCRSRGCAGGDCDC